MALDAQAAGELRAVVRAQPLAALATLHRGEPAASMVPVALLADGSAFVLHVSRLATHTKDLLEHPRVALLLVGVPEAGQMPQSVARLSVSGDAEPCVAAHAQHAQARAAYLERYPDAEPMFDFADFSLVLVRPRSARWVGGFAQATTLLPAELQPLLAGAAGGAPA